MILIELNENQVKTLVTSLFLASRSPHVTTPGAAYAILSLWAYINENAINTDGSEIPDIQEVVQAVEEATNDKV